MFNNLETGSQKEKDMKKSKGLKQQIRQKINRMRGESDRKRKKKFSYLKHTGSLGTYYLQKQGINVKGKIKGNIRGLQRIDIPINSSQPQSVPEPVVEKKGFISKIKSLFKGIKKLNQR